MNGPLSDGKKPGSRVRALAGIAAVVAAFALLVAPTARAQLSIVNSSFESPVMTPAGFTTAVPPGWTLVSGNFASVGVFYPTVPNWGYIAPTGNQLLYLNGATVEQQLATNVAPGENDLLAVQVVRRPNFFTTNYRIDFFAGEILLGSDLGTLSPPLGGSLVSLISYTAGPLDPAVGQPLKIRLGGATQTNYDNVRVFVPEPRVGWALAAMLPFMA